MALAPLASSTRFFGRFLGRTIGEAAAFSAGVAIGPVLGPIVQEERNQVNAKYPFKPLDLGDLAEIVAEDVEQKPWGEDEAAKTGFDAENFDALLGAVLNAPGVPLLLTLWRRGEIADADFLHGLRKARLEGQWDAPLRALKIDRLAPSQIALGIVRSVIRDPGLLVVTLDTSDSNVPQYEPLSLDALEEAMASGVDRERLRGMVGEIGLPMPVVRAANAYFRGILTRGAYNQAVLEGDTRPEWGDAILEEARQIPSAANFVEKRLRGWTDDAGMYAGTERHGMSREDTDTLFLIHGRPPSWHQVWIGLQRGGTFDGPLTDIDPAFLKALRESDIRPEWYNLLWHSRYNYPAPFVLRTLTQGHDITEGDAEEILKFLGWEPTLRAKVARRWAAARAAAQKEASAAELLALYDGRKATRAETMAALEALDYPTDEAAAKIDVLDARRVTSARNAAISDLHAAFKKGDLTAALVTPALAKLVNEPDTAPHIVAAWQAYRDAFPPPEPAAVPPAV